MRTGTQRRSRFTVVVAALAAAVSALALAATPANAAAATGVRINEVESSGGSPGDWVELVNTGTTAADLSSWTVEDDDDAHVFTIASGTVLAPGAFRALDVDPVFGLGSADSARLFQPGSTTPVDSYSWSKHASTTYGRCPDGTGAFTTTAASTKGAANSCPPQAWPGGTSVAVADAANAFGTNLSGLSFDGPSVLWAVKNGPGTLYRLVPNGTAWRPDPAGPASGTTLRYAGGSGDPDAEGVVVTPDGVFVATERDNSHDGSSLPQILRYSATSVSATSLPASGTWNLSADLPGLPANGGPEAISWVPDSYLTAHGFRDEHTNAAYAPTSYPGHGTGLYLVGVETGGSIVAYALNLSGSGYTRVATIASGFTTVMDLEFEPSAGRLWAACDDTCDGHTATLSVDAQGRFAGTAVYERPSGMPNYNNEGFAISPSSSCASGRRPVLWSDDGDDQSHALRSGTLNCVP